MTEAHALRDELRGCVNNYVLQSRHKRISKASTADLAVMACISSDGPLPVSEAVSWMYHHSDKFSDSIDNMISKGSYRQPVSLSDNGLNVNSDKSTESMVKRLEKSPHWQEKLRVALNNFTVPIYECEEMGSTYWWSPVSSANVFLKRRLFPLKTGTRRTVFRIMDLPVEVREMIFEFALLLPRSGVWYDFQTRHKVSGEPRLTLRAWTRDRDSTWSQYLPNTWNTDRDLPRAQPKGLFQVDLKRHLALFSVSKQVYKESFPCFYSKNAFYLPSNYAFLKLFENLSDAQFCYLGHIIWRWTRTGLPSEKQVQQFAALPRLRTLVIDDAKEEDDDQVDVTFGWSSNAGLSSSDVAHLTAIKGLQDVVFFGPVAAHEHFLRSQMVGWKS